MQKRIIFLLFISLLCCLKVNAQFQGSNGDGYDDRSLSAVTLTNVNIMILYEGGNGDGFSENLVSGITLQNTSLAVLYSGGNGDGFDNRTLNATTLQNTPLFTLYEGGNGDGYSGNLLSATTLDNTPLFSLYEGGNGDGFDNRSLNATTLSNTQLIVLYSGGNGDGYDEGIVNATTLNNTQLVVLYSGGNGDGFDADQETSFLNPNQVVDLYLKVKVYLQGPLLNPATAGLMNDNLRSASYIPSTSPYDMTTTVPNTAVFNDGGISGTGVANDNIVDWVVIEIRSNADNTNIVDSVSALLQRDGDVVALDGTSNVILQGLTDSYFVSVKHRNHLAAMTQNTFALSVSPTNIDFTNNATQTFGSNAQIQLSNGSMALWAGNVNADTLVQYSGTSPDTPNILSNVLNDPGNFLNFPTYTVNGYNMNDIDMDGSTQYSGTDPDAPFILQNVLAHPGNFLNFSTYQILEQLPEN